MSEENIALVRRAWQAYDKGDEVTFASCLTEDWKEYDLGGNLAGTLEGDLQTMRAHKVAFPDKHTDILRIVSDANQVACLCRTSATHTGKYLDLEPTGKKVLVHVVMFNRIGQGRIAETTAVVMGKGFYEQLSGRTARVDLDNMS